MSVSKKVYNILIPVFEKYFFIHITAFQTAVGITGVLLLGTALILGIVNSIKIKEVVTEDFNRQQLGLAQYAASQIEHKLEMIKKELSMLGLSPTIQYIEKVSINKRLVISFSRIIDDGVYEIRFVETVNNITYMVDASGYQVRKHSLIDRDLLKWARDKGNQSKIWTSEVNLMVDSKGRQKLALIMAMPVWQISVDESHPVITNKFSGVMLFLIDVPEITGRITWDIKSGKTGYSWVIDNKGIFLFHPELDFIGKNAFEARKEKKPTISFARINEIQKNMMLAGKEGTSWYVSGWHKDIKGEIKKLIAYSPVRLDDGKIWSVAVVAPASEIEDSIHAILQRQFLIEGLVSFFFVVGSVFLIGIMMDWSNQLKREVKEKTGELEKSEKQYRLLVENANDIIFTTNIDGDILSMNKAGFAFFHRTMEDIIGRNLGDICFNESSAHAQYKAIEHVFETKESAQITYMIKQKEGEYWLTVNFSAILDSDGNVASVLGIARDITERKKIEDQMYYTEKLAAMGTLAAGVAHEINNPLAIILGFTDLLIEKSSNEPETVDVLKTIEKQGNKAKRVVENLLSFARYTENKEENVDINKNLQALIAVTRNTLSMNKITLDVDMEENLPRVKGDPDELHQVFFNIINNAMAVMKGGGSLTIRTTSVLFGSNVEIRISDTGGGIKTEHRNRIFDPLFTTKKVGEGTGLGLSIAYGVITKYGGTISFETKTKDESDNTGTTFIIRLPAIT
jgi:PAS domain S-box-containing protein